MHRPISLILFIAAYACCGSIYAQDKSARDRLLTARALYYTPTASGLQSFHCDATLDWKAMLSRFGGTEISDENPLLKYLMTVKLSVTDQLRGKGALEWTETSSPPEEIAKKASQTRGGLQTTVEGFFQSWNPFMNGTAVPMGDSSITYEAKESGFHLSGSSQNIQMDEDFDTNMVLTRILVVTPGMKALAIPTYTDTPDGLVVSALTSQVHQSPSAPQMEVTFRMEYATVDSFRLLSNIVLDIKNVGSIEIGLSACRASVAESTKQQSSGKSEQSK
jgi:hypothetical protein